MAMARAEFRKAYSPSVSKPTPTDFGVFHWSGGSGHYPRESALVVYRTESGAQKYADKRNAGDATLNLVVRRVGREGAAR